MKIIKNVISSVVGVIMIWAMPPAFSETTNTPESTRLEEVTVTGRKRVESLTDVPVSISVFDADTLAALGIVTQDNLFEATPGLDYSNWSGNRNQNNPGVRGVQSDLRATNQQKVASFVDGMPMLGNQGSLQFSGIENVEIYRGPQSAAFGRSTFAGAINYVTADSSDELTGKVQVKTSNLESQEIGLLVSGPITENLGYRISYVKDEFTGPDEWTATDGTEMGREETDLLIAKLNFKFSDTAYGEIMYSRSEAFDRPGAGWVADTSTCSAGSGVWLNTMGADVELPLGEWNCDLSAPSGGIPRNTNALDQFLGQYDANIGFYTAAAGMADTDMDGSVSSSEFLAQTFADGQTYEQALLTQTVGDAFFDTNRDRLQGELNFEIGDGVLQIMGMMVEEDSDFWFDADNTNSVGAFSVNMMTMQTSLAANVMTMAMIGTVEEFYVETRWISPEDQRLRYTLSGSFYDYDLQSQVYNGYGALARGLTLPNGDPVSPIPGITISEVATNIGASFGLQYDLTDRTTFSLESRYQIDEVCGIDANGANVEDCKETKAILPRIALNHTLSESHSIYGQISLGNNPAGVNIAYSDPGNILALAVASGQIPSPEDGFTYDGSDGVHFPVVDYDATTFPSFEEEELLNFEIGGKGSFADQRGQYTAALYFMDYENIIGAENLNWDDTNPNGWNENNWTAFTGERTWINQGDGEMYGLELTADFAVNDIFQVGGYVTLSEAKYTDYCSIQGANYRDAPGGNGGGGNHVLPLLTPAADGVNSSCSIVNGNTIPKQSNTTANLNLSAALPNPIFGLNTSLRMDVSHKGSYFEDQLNLLERGAVTTINISANMRNENWTVRLFANNVTDVDDPVRANIANNYTTNANPSIAPTGVGSWLINPRRPREVGLQVAYQF